MSAGAGRVPRRQSPANDLMPAFGSAAPVSILATTRPIEGASWYTRASMRQSLSCKPESPRSQAEVRPPFPPRAAAHFRKSHGFATGRLKEQRSSCAVTRVGRGPGDIHHLFVEGPEGRPHHLHGARKSRARLLAFLPQHQAGPEFPGADRQGDPRRQAHGPGVHGQRQQLQRDQERARACQSK